MLTDLMGQLVKFSLFSSVFFFSIHRLEIESLQFVVNCNMEAKTFFFYVRFVTVYGNMVCHVVHIAARQQLYTVEYVICI